MFSGAYENASTPLADYLGNAVPIASATLYLVDPGGVVVASNRQLPEGLAGLGTLDPALAASLARRPAGGYRSGAEERYYASRAVEGTPWRLVLAVPRSELYQPVDGPGRWVPWLVLVAFALAALHQPPSRVLPAAEDEQVGVFEGYLRHKSAYPWPWRCPPG